MTARGDEVARRPSRRVRRLRLRGLLVWGACLAGATHGTAAGVVALDSQRRSTCLAAVSSTPTAGQPERLQSLRALAAMRDQCLDVPEFLALLGGLYLDAGNAQDALVWLERALLLDPGNLGAQADMTLAMAALGSPEPLEALLTTWRQRRDIPPALLQRMAVAADPSLRYRLPVVPLGDASSAVQKKAWRAEASVTAGHESNLDRSPRLTELTLTIPGGELVVPVVDQEHRGRAAQVAAAIQWQRDLTAAWQLRATVAAGARLAPSHGDTDWRQTQLALAVVHQAGPWRSQLESTNVWVAGPLGEPFRQQRWAFQIERDLLNCRARLAAESEERAHRETTSLDAEYRGVVYGLQCGLSHTWAAGVLWRRGADDDIADVRPGGRQRLRSMVGVLQGRIGEGKMELSWRASSAEDTESYSELLESGAVRQLDFQQLAAEWAWPLSTKGVEWLVQWQSSRQRSNLVLFAYRARAVYTGVRAEW